MTTNSTITKNEEEFRLTRAERIGQEGEENVGLKLVQAFGFRNVSRGINGFSSGSDGYPDIKLLLHNHVFFIEVKSIVPFTKRYGKNITNRQNSVKLNRFAWDRLKTRAKAKLATIIMIVELRLVGENDYFIIEYDTLEDFVLKTEVEWVHIPLWFLLGKCKKIEFSKTEFVMNPIESTQNSLNL